MGEFRANLVSILLRLSGRFTSNFLFGRSPVLDRVGIYTLTLRNFSSSGEGPTKYDFQPDQELRDQRPTVDYRVGTYIHTYY